MDASYEMRPATSRIRRLLVARDFAQAEKELDDALALFPDHAELLALAADLQRRMGKLSEAQSYLKRAEASDPSRRQVVEVGADLAYDRKEYEKAGHMELAIEQYEMNVTDCFGGTLPYDRLRIIYTRSKRYLDAVRVCEAFLALPVNPSVLKPAGPHFQHHREKLNQKLRKQEK